MPVFDNCIPRSRITGLRLPNAAGIYDEGVANLFLERHMCVPDQQYVSPCESAFFFPSLIRRQAICIQRVSGRRVTESIALVANRDELFKLQLAKILLISLA